MINTSIPYQNSGSSATQRSSTLQGEYVEYLVISDILWLNVQNETSTVTSFSSQHITRKKKRKEQTYQNTYCRTPQTISSLERQRTRHSRTKTLSKDSQVQQEQVAGSLDLLLDIVQSQVCSSLRALSERPPWNTYCISTSVSFLCA